MKNGRLVIYQIGGYSLAENPALNARRPSGKEVPSLYDDWMTVCMGKAGKMGRIPTLLYESFVERADLIIWSTGATVLDDGTSEAEYMYNFALRSYPDLLLEFPQQFGGEPWFRASEMTASVYQSWLREKSVFDTKSTNTRTSMLEAANIIGQKYKIDTPMILRLVSSGNHVMRVMRDALVAFDPDGEYPFSNLVISTVAAQTNYGMSKPKHTVVLDRGE